MDKDRLQRKLLVSSLVHCAGFKLIEEELKEFIAGVECEQMKALSGPCNDLGGINYINGWRRGLKDLEYMLQGFREELEEKEQIAEER